MTLQELLPFEGSMKAFKKGSSICLMTLQVLTVLIYQGFVLGHTNQISLLALSRILNGGKRTVLCSTVAPVTSNWVWHLIWRYSVSQLLACFEDGEFAVKTWTQHWIANGVYRCCVLNHENHDTIFKGSQCSQVWQLWHGYEVRSSLHPTTP